MKTNTRFASKKDALTASLQAGAAHDLAVAKSRRQFKRQASEKKAYKPGELGISEVSKAIKEEYGRILPRHTRRWIAKTSEQPFQKFYAQG
ncbi:hypothetical protein D3C74_361720 [compost metagenome]